MNFKNIFTITLLLSFPVYADNAINIIDSINADIRNIRSTNTRFHKNKYKDIGTNVDKIFDLVKGKTATISSSTYAKEKDRLTIFESLFHAAHTHDERYFENFTDLRNSTLKDYEVRHLFAFEIMRNVANFMYENIQELESYDKTINIAEGIANGMNDYFGCNIIYNKAMLHKLLPISLINKFISSYNFIDIHTYEKEGVNNFLYNINSPYTIEIIGMYDFEAEVFNHIQELFKKSTYIFNQIKEEDLSDQEASDNYQNTYNDYEIAKALYEEVNKPEKNFEFYNFDKLDAYEIKQKLVPVVNILENIQPDVDVHTLTTSFVRPYYSQVKEAYQYLERQLGLNDSILTFDEVNELFKPFRVHKDISITNRLQNFETTMALIQGYYNSPVDQETGVNVAEIMSYVLHLAIHNNELGNIFDCIAENKQNGGGCHPGVTGRLFIRFTSMVNAYFESL